MAFIRLSYFLYVTLRMNKLCQTKIFYFSKHAVQMI